MCNTSYFLTIDYFDCVIFLLSPLIRLKTMTNRQIGQERYQNGKTKTVCKPISYRFFSQRELKISFINQEKTWGSLRH